MLRELGHGRSTVRPELSSTQVTLCESVTVLNPISVLSDVTEIPSDGSVWFQLIKDGQLTLNEGPNGLQKLDKIVYFAEKIGLHLQFVLTNNWNPVEGEVPGKGKDGLRKRHNDKRPRNYLSNDYGQCLTVRFLS